MLIVADANELFSALIAKGETLNLFFNSKFEIISPEFILEEFKKHQQEISNKSSLNKNELITFLLLLTYKIKFIDEKDYADFLIEAENITPDKNDIDYLALALKFNCPIWSEDKKLKEQQNKVKILSTFDLMKEL